MPLPSPRGKEERKKFVSRCVSFMTRKGEGKDAAQRVAICNSRFKKAKAGEILYEEEAEAIGNLMAKPEFTGGPDIVTDLNRKPKKKKKDKFRITLQDGSGTDPTAAKKHPKTKKKKKKAAKPAKGY